MYKDDGLAVFKNKSGTQSEKIKKAFQSLFRQNDFQVTIKCYLRIINYLGITLNLSNSTFRPFFKSSNKINYMSKESATHFQ